MEIGSALILFGAGLLAGALNAAAGGGSFVTIPAMVSVGLPSVAANASSTVALLPGTLASAWAWRRDFRPFEGIPLRTMLLISLGGGLAGALLLLATPQRAFDALLPWLLLAATLVFAFGRGSAAVRDPVRRGDHGRVLLAGVGVTAAPAATPASALPARAAGGSAHHGVEQEGRYVRGAVVRRLRAADRHEQRHGRVDLPVALLGREQVAAPVLLAHDVADAPRHHRIAVVGEPARAHRGVQLVDGG
jgi:Sulfite exporter TauE/SafE